MRKTAVSSESCVLNDGAKIAVVGGGPAGSFFSLFALKMAGIVGKDLDVTIFEPKDFSQSGAKGCNNCGGIISELLVQTLAVEGINLPETVVRKGVNSYQLHSTCGDASISTPALEKTIAAVYRGGGPRGVAWKGMQSFDGFLLDLAIQEGAVHSPTRIDKVEIRDGRPVVYADGSEAMAADLVVGAFGVNGKTPEVFENIGFGYRRPKTTTTAIVEINIDNTSLASDLGDSVHLFLLPAKQIKFAAVIPKERFVTLCVLGHGLNSSVIRAFLDDPVVTKVLPPSATAEVDCKCFPKMSVSAAKKPFTDRIVMCGDAGSTRLFKDGIGAAYLTAKAAAKTAVFSGVHSSDFARDYYPVYNGLISDNRYGRCLFLITDIFRKSKAMTGAMVSVVIKEQQSETGRKALSSFLWDMFTGSERYKKIFFRAIDIGMCFNLGKAAVRNLFRRRS